MKSQITHDVGRLLDQALQMADEPRLTQEKIVKIMAALLDVGEWDTRATETIRRAVREARVSLDELLDVLHVGVEETPVTGDR